MINSITFKANKKAPKHIKRCFGNSSKDVTYNFTDGLNLIIGDNGCGKSTLCDLISRGMFVCDKTRTHTEEPQNYVLIGDVPDLDSDKQVSDNIGTKINFDLSLPFCIYFNNSILDHKANLSAAQVGLGAFDFKTSVSNLLVDNEQSFGENIFTNFDITFQHASKFSLKTKSDRFKKWFKENTKDNCKKPTIILDEFDSGLSIPKQYMFWEELIPQLLNNYQIIVVSHSVLPILMDVKNTNVISWYGKKETKKLKNHFKSYENKQ